MYVIYSFVFCTSYRTSSDEECGTFHWKAARNASFTESMSWERWLIPGWIKHETKTKKYHSHQIWSEMIYIELSWGVLINMRTIRALLYFICVLREYRLTQPEMHTCLIIVTISSIKMCWLIPWFVSGCWKTTQIAKSVGANMGPTWVLSAPDGPHVGPMNLETAKFDFSSMTLPLICDLDFSHGQHLCQWLSHLIVSWYNDRNIVEKCVTERLTDGLIHS